MNIDLNFINENAGEYPYWDLHATSLYLYMVAWKLSEETGVHFSKNSNDYITCDLLDFKLSKRDFTSYEDILKKAEDAILATGESPDKAKVRSKLNWLTKSLSLPGKEGIIRIGYYGSIADAFDILNYAVNGIIPENRSFGLSMEKQYADLSTFTTIPELKDVQVKSFKNQNFQIKGLTAEEWIKIEDILKK